MVCAECQCAPEECAKDINDITRCKNCIRPVCCCIDLYQDSSEPSTDEPSQPFFDR